MEYLVIAILILIMLILIGFSRTQKQGFEKKPEEKPEEKDVFSNFCPLCGSGLKKGERVKSAAYPVKPGSDGKYPGGIEKMMEVYGCPHCMPPGGTEKRICPVCKKEVPKNGYVVGRYFIVNKTYDYSSGEQRTADLPETGIISGNKVNKAPPVSKKKNHLHVLGCTGCRRV